MKKAIAVAVILVVLSTALVLYAKDVTCPIDGSGAYWTGKIKYDRPTGKALWLYKCVRVGHEFWVVK